MNDDCASDALPVEAAAVDEGAIATAEAEAKVDIQGDADVALEGEADDVAFEADVAPVAAMRELTCACVAHVMLVPSELTSGSAAQTSPVPQEVNTNAPLTHWANSPLTQAFSPAVQDEFTVRDLNWLFNAIAASPFCFRKLLSRGMYRGRASAAEKRVATKTVVNFMLGIVSVV